MRKYLTLLGLVALAACGEKAQQPPAGQAPAAQPAPASPASPAAAASGAAVFQRTCQACHQVNGRGMPGTFPPLAGSEIANGATPKLIRIALHGLQGPVVVKGQRYNGVMPPWRSLSDGEMAAVLTYVRASFGNAAGPVSAADVAAERAATASRTTPWTITELER